MNRTILWQFLRWPGLLLSLLVLVSACQAEAQSGTSATSQPTAFAPEAGSDYPNSQLLLDTAWLVERLDEPTVRIFDLRSPAAYEQAHIPGAVNVPIQAIASTINNLPLEFDRAEVENVLNRSGLDPEMTAVIYDDLGMMNSTRLFWTLEYVGHQDVRLLNGGWNAWLAGEHPTTTAVPQFEPSTYPVRLDASKIVTADEVLERLDNPEVMIVDARSPQEYSGEVKLADRGGHIPGAVNLVWLEALSGGDAVYTINDDWAAQLQDEDVELFKPATELQALLEERDITPDQEVITYCQTLWRGAHVYFLLRLMGFDRVRGYDGSWAEWGNRADLPVVTGSTPGSLAEARSVE